MFLKKTDTEIDDTDRIQRALDYCISNAANFSNNVYVATNGNTGTLVDLTSGEKLIATNNILMMNRGARNEFVIGGGTENVISNNNYIKHT